MQANHMQMLEWKMSESNKNIKQTKNLRKTRAINFKINKINETLVKLI
jgi:hypothetical protein